MGTRLRRGPRTEASSSRMNWVATTPRVLAVYGISDRLLALLCVDFQKLLLREYTSQRRGRAFCKRNANGRVCNRRDLVREPWLP